MPSPAEALTEIERTQRAAYSAATVRWIERRVVARTAGKVVR